MAIGIENLKLVAKSGVDLGTKLAETFEDGKITLPEGFNLLTGLMGIPDLLKRKAEIKAEWKDLDTDERNQIKAYVAAELKIPNNPGLERKIEKGIALILDILEYINEFKKPVSPTPPI